MAVLTPVLTGGNGIPTYNVGIAETYSWIPIQNDQNRPMYARAGYITNLKDLQISLSASNLNIGTVHLQDGQDGSLASVVQAGTKYALLVQNQDLVSTIDSITIGDNKGNLATVTASSLNVNVTNVNALTANLATSINQVITNTFLNSITANQATAINQIVTNTLLNSVTSNQGTQITLGKTLSANSVYGTLSSQPLYTTTTNIVTAVTILNPGSLSAVILNPQIEITNDVGNPIPISTSQILSISGAVTVTTSVSTTPTGTQQVSYADGYQIDQSGRLRVAAVGEQWWYTSSVDKDGDLRFQEAFAGTGQSIFVQNYAATLMTSGSASNGSGIRMTRRRFPVRPGVGLQWFGTWNWDGNDVGVVKRCGWNTSFNGMFFELSGGDMNIVVRRRLPDGTLNESRVPRSQFNGDKLDGLGVSGENWNTPQLSAYTSNTLTPTVTAVAVQNALSAFNINYKTTTAASASAFQIGSKVTVQGFLPITFNGCAVVKSYDTTNSIVTLTYPFNPGTYSSGAATGSIIQNAYHGTHTYFFDMFGGRTNRVRFGKITDAGEIILHTFKFDGQFGGPFTSAPSMPIRKEIFNTQAVNLQPSLSLFGTALNIEAESVLNPCFAAAHNNNYLLLDYNTPAGGNLNEYPLLGVGLRPGEPYQRGDLQIQSINMIDIKNIGGSNNGGAISWRLLLNPVLSGSIPTPTNIGKASRHWEYTVADHSTNGVNLSAGAASQGIELMTGYLASVGTIDVKTSLNFLNLGSNVDYSDADKVVLMVRQLSPAAADAQVVASMNIIEAL